MNLADLEDFENDFVRVIFLAISYDFSLLPIDDFHSSLHHFPFQSSFDILKW